MRDHGVETTLIEAADRVGGRAWTGAIASHPFDHGATWLHDAGRNPLVALAMPEDRLIDTDRSRRQRLSIAGRLASPAEQEAYAAAWDRLESVVAPALDGPDQTLAAAMASMMGDPWALLVARWEGSIIAAADAGRLGLRDWHRNRLEGHNLVPQDGVGAFITRRLHTQATLNTQATRIAWHGRGVAVHTQAGIIQAGVAIITVSTGVLANGAITFDPPLPPEIQASIHALPMGLLTKIGFPLPVENDALAPGAVLVDRDGSIMFNVRPLGRPYLTGFAGGDQAWDLAHDPQALEDLARAELRQILGSEILSTIPPAAIVTDWGTHPLHAGAYAYAGPGDAGHRGALASAFPGERLLFAGEAVRTDGLAGTVGGAYLSGIEAARRVLGPGNPA